MQTQTSCQICSYMFDPYKHLSSRVQTRDGKLYTIKFEEQISEDQCKYSFKQNLEKFS